MSDKVTKIIDIELTASEAVKGMTQLTVALNTNKKTLKELENEYKTGQMSAEEYAQAQVEIKTQNKILTTQLQTYQKEIVKSVTEEKAQVNSIKALREEYNAGKKALEEMSGAERESAEGQALAEHLKTQKEAINEAEESMGIYNGRVGSYEDAIKNALPFNNQFASSILSVTKNSTGASKGVVAFSAGIAALSAVVAVVAGRIKELNERIENNETLNDAARSQLSLADAYDVAYTRMLDKQADFWVGFQTRSKTVWSNIVATVNSGIGSLLEAFGASDELVSSFKDNTSFSQLLELTLETSRIRKEEVAYRTQSRKFMIEEEELQRDINKLWADSSDKQNLTNEERLTATKKALDMEIELSEKRIALAKQEFEIFSARVELAGSPTEDLDKQVQMKANIIRMAGEIESKRSSYNERINETTTALNAENKARESSLASSQETLYQLTLSMQEQNEALEKEALQHGTDLAIAEIETRLAEESNMTQAERETLNKTIVALREKQAQEEVEIEKKYSKEVLDQRIADKQQEYSMAIKEAELAKAKISRIDYEDDDSYAEAQAEASRAIADAKLAELQNNFDALRELTEEEQEAMFESTEEYNEALVDAETDLANQRVKIQEDASKASQDASDAERATREKNIKAIAGTFGTMSSLIATAGEDSKAAAIASQTLAIAEIAVNTGLAVAKGINMAQSVPFPGNIAAIATTITTILAGITSAVSSVKSAKFAEGGLVTGEGTSTSDSIPANLSNGEYVVNAASVSALGVDTLDALNSADSSSAWVGAVLSAMNIESGSSAIDTSFLMGGLGYEKATLREAFREALNDIPSPVVSMVDINKEQKTTQVQNNLAQLR